MPPPATTLPADYPSRVKSIRERLDLTQVRFAERIGVSFATVNRWENGQTRPARLAWRQILDLEAGLAPADARLEATGGPAAAPALDFSARPAVVAAVAEATRLSYGHLSNPAFATEVSLIDPLPHQRIAVYERMLGLSPFRFLLADDAGAGKTIMTGLYLREVLARRLIRRVLVVPAGRAGRQLGTGDADAVLAAVPDRARCGRARREPVRGSGERPGDRQCRHAGRRAHVRSAARRGGVRGRAVRPGGLRRGAQARCPPAPGPLGRQDGSLLPRRGAGRVAGRRAAVGARAGRRRTSCC